MSAASRNPAATWASSEGVRRSMQGNRRCDTGPERRLRSVLHSLGRRFRKDYRLDLDSLRVRVDIAFTAPRVAVFVDGCFWHRCPEHGTDPHCNGEFWRRKLDANVARDRRVDTALEAAGWTVLRVWEHEPPGTAADRITTVLSRAGRSETECA